MVINKEFPQPYYHLAVLALVILTSLFVSCSGSMDSSEEESEEQKAIKEAEYWVDQDQPDRSIELLNPYLNEKMVSIEQNRMRQVLASAYIKRSGIELEDFVEFLGQLKKLSSLTENLEEEIDQKIQLALAANPALKPNEEDRDIIVSFYRLLFILGDIVELIDVLPYTENSGRPDLERAIEILDVENSLTPLGQKLYKASLRLILINGKIRNKEYFSSLELCPVAYANFSKEMNSFQKDITLFLKNLHSALPKSQRDIDKVLKSVQGFSVDTLDEPELERIQSFLVGINWSEASSCL